MFVLNINLGVYRIQNENNTVEKGDVTKRSQ